MTPARRRLVFVALWLGAVVTPLYWILWYADRASVASNKSSAYYEFENAFPLADGWLVLALIGSIIALRRGWASTSLWLAVAGGAAVYLFCMDSLYDVENKIWWKSGAGGWIELVINVLTLTLAGVILDAARRLHTPTT